jgi:putative addiction module component (TIGR02574 family)
VKGNLADLKQHVLELPLHERAELALSIIESLDGPPDPDVEAAWQREIERRCAEIDRGEAKLIPGDEVMERVRRKLA